MVMFLFNKNSRKKKLCSICGVNYLPDSPAIVKLQAQDGIVEISVCDDCANFFDKSAEILTQKKGTTDGGSV